MQIWELTAWTLLMVSLRNASSDTCSDMNSENAVCRFNHTWCGWNNSGWSLHSKRADPRLFTYCSFETEPECNLISVNDTWKRNLGYEFLDNRQNRDITARFLTAEFPASLTDVCLQFRYRSRGTYRWTLSVTIVSSNQVSENSVLWSSSSKTGNDWHLVHVSISARRLTQPFQLAFDGNIAFSDMDFGLAVDDLRTAPGSCPNHGDCSFEVICPSWHQYDNTTETWAHGYFPGNSPGGPYDDHTFGNHHGRYIYVSGRGTQSGNRAVLYNDDLQQHHCLSFWFYKSPGTSRLTVRQWYNSTWTAVWTYDRSNWTTHWTYATALLKDVKPLRLQLEANVHSGVMAIDDVMFYNTTCPSEGEYTRGAVADMSNKRARWFTDLVIPLTCTQTNYTITITYRINCLEGVCMLIILQNVDGQVLPLWNTTEYSHDIQTKTVPVLPRGTNSSISIQAWKNNDTGWSFEVILETVTLKKSGIATSATEETTRMSETPNAITSTPGTTSQRRHVDVETTASEPNAGLQTTQLASMQPDDVSTDALDRSADENEASNDSGNGLAIGLGVSVAVVAVVLVVVIIVLIRRKGSDGNTGGFTGILNRWRKKQKPETTPDILKLGEMNSTYSPEMRPENELPASSGLDNTYAKVNKPKPQDVYSVPQKGPKTASKPRSTSNCGRSHETGDQSETPPSDYYSTAAAATSRNDRKPKVDNGYELAATVQSTAVYSTPRNTPKQNAESTPSNVKTDDGQDGEYNTISHQPLRAARAAPGTNQVYDHVGKKDQGAPTDTDRTNEYSLARPAANDSSASTGNGQKTRNYVNVASSTTSTLPPGEEEYNSLHFDHGRSSSAAVTDRDEEGGHAVYNHLQGDEEYNSLQFDGRGQGQQSGEDIDNMYSHVTRK